MAGPRMITEHQYHGADLSLFVLVRTNDENEAITFFYETPVLLGSSFP